MAYSLLAHTFSVGASGGSTTPSIDTTGADLIVFGIVYSTGHKPTLSDSKSNSWTAVGSAQENANNGCQLYYNQGGTVGAGHTFTVAASSSFSSAFIGAFSGSVASPLDQNIGNQQAPAGFSITAGSVTPTQNNELIAAIQVNFGSSGAQAMDSGVTLTDTQGASSPTWGSALGYKIQTTAAAINITGSCDSSNAMAIAVASFKAPSTGTNVNLTAVSAAGIAEPITSTSNSALTGVSATGTVNSFSLQITSNVTLAAAACSGVAEPFGNSPAANPVPAIAHGVAGQFTLNGTFHLVATSAQGVANRIGSSAQIVSLACIGKMRDTLPVDAIASNRPVASNGTMRNIPVPAIGSLLAA